MQQTCLEFEGIEWWYNRQTYVVFQKWGSPRNGRLQKIPSFEMDDEAWGTPMTQETSVSTSGTPSSHPFLDGIFPYKPTSYWGTPHFRKPPLSCLNYETYSDESPSQSLRSSDSHQSYEAIWSFPVRKQRCGWQKLDTPAEFGWFMGNIPKEREGFDSQNPVFFCRQKDHGLRSKPPWPVP